MIQTDKTALKPGGTANWIITQSMEGVDYNGITQFKFHVPFTDVIEYPAGNIYYDGELNKDRDGTMRTEEHACTYTFSADGLAAIKEKRPSVIEFHIRGYISSSVEVPGTIDVTGYVTIGAETQDTDPVKTYLGESPYFAPQVRKYVKISSSGDSGNATWTFTDASTGTAGNFIFELASGTGALLPGTTQVSTDENGLVAFDAVMLDGGKYVYEVREMRSDRKDITWDSVGGKSDGGYSEWHELRVEKTDVSNIESNLSKAGVYIPDLTYNGSSQKAKVYHGQNHLLELIEDKDFKVLSGTLSGVNAGNFQVSIQGVGLYTGIVNDIRWNIKNVAGKK